MTPERLAEIEARAAAATKGPWHRHHRDASVPDTSDTDSTLGGLLGWEIEGPPEPDRGQLERAADAAFIACARDDIPALCAALREAYAGLDSAQDAISRLEGLRCAAQRALDEARMEARGYGLEWAKAMADSDRSDGEEVHLHLTVGEIRRLVGARC